MTKYHTLLYYVHANNAACFHFEKRNNYAVRGQCTVKFGQKCLNVSREKCTSVDSEESVQPPIKLRDSKLCSVSSLTLIEYSSN